MDCCCHRICIEGDERGWITGGRKNDLRKRKVSESPPSIQQPISPSHPSAPFICRESRRSNRIRMIDYTHQKSHPLIKEALSSSSIIIITFQSQKPPIREYCRVIVRFPQFQPETSPYPHFKKKEKRADLKEMGPLIECLKLIQRIDETMRGRVEMRIFFLLFPFK